MTNYYKIYNNEIFIIFDIEINIIYIAGDRVELS